MHIEPGLDAAVEKLHRKRIDQCAGQNGNQCKHQHHAQHQARAEYLGAHMAPQLHEAGTDQQAKSSQ
ncbi:hypothetical protein D3C72_2580420 [compost metagenome]